MIEPAITFRLIQRAEAPQLGAINRACPIEADFRLLFERGEDFFQWPDLIYDRYQYLGAFSEGELVGYIMVGLFRGWTGEGFGVCGYLGDARVLPSFRGRHIASRMMRAIEAFVPADVQLGFALVKKGNLPAQSLADAANSAAYEGHILTNLDVLNMPLLRPPTVSSALTIRNARLDDLGAMVELFHSANKGRLFAPALTRDRLKNQLVRHGAPATGDYLVAEYRGELLGMLAAWDMHSLHYTRVLKYSLSGQILRFVYNVAARFSEGATPLPASGGALRTLTLTRVAILDQDAAILRAMLTRLIQANLGKGYHLLSAGFSIGDPLLQAVRGFPLVQHFRSSLYVIVPRSSPIGAYNDLPYIDLAMI